MKWKHLVYQLHYVRFSYIASQATYVASATLCVTDRVGVHPRPKQQSTHELCPAAIQPSLPFQWCPLG